MATARYSIGRSKLTEITRTYMSRGYEEAKVQPPKEGSISVPLTIGILLACFLGATGVVYAFTIGLDRNEMVECNKWQAQAEEFPARVYYIAQWQKDQCDAHGITINASVTEKK